jgi:hypothetical protein
LASARSKVLHAWRKVDFCGWPNDITTDQLRLFVDGGSIAEVTWRSSWAFVVYLVPVGVVAIKEAPATGVSTLAVFRPMTTIHGGHGKEWAVGPQALKVELDRVTQIMAPNRMMIRLC